MKTTSVTVSYDRWTDVDHESDARAYQRQHYARAQALADEGGHRVEIQTRDGCVLDEVDPR